ncbi:Melanoma-associated antigen G1 [Toxocara canis]|uniref:Melanoma-associated antigen G1 n=1 Tax=Toxocara canis TaxID=6265 RepID=A0A0B2V185_TOXCA|nr:Melanoma-associated antigen G1 [Toxocara canis]
MKGKTNIHSRLLADPLAVCRTRKNATTAKELTSKERAILAEAAQFFLFMQHKGGMVREADLKRIISKISSIDSQQLVLEILKERLKTLVGFEVVAVPSPQGNWLVAKDTLTFLEAAGDHPFNFTRQKEKLKGGFLNAVLMYLYMAKNPSSASGVPEEDLWQFIKGLGESSFAGIGDPKSLIGANPGAEFVSQGWIEYKKTIQADGSEVVTYSWGPRSVTIDRMKLLEEFCKIDSSDPRQWKDHWKDATESNGTTVVANDNLVSESEQGCSHP